MQAAASSVRNEVTDFLARVRAADSPDTLAELAASCARELAPHQLRRLYALVQALGDAGRAGIFLEKSPLRVRLARQEPPIYRNTLLSSHARLFGAVGTPRSRKVLLVQFGDVFITAPRLLMRLPPGAFDLLRLRAADGRDFPHGVPGFGDSFASVCRGIAGLSAGYAGTVALGGSLGALTALRAAVLLRMRAGIALAGRFSSLRWIKDQRAMPGFDPLCACIAAPDTMLRNYFSAGHALDTRQGQVLATMRPAVRLISVPQGNDHNVLAVMIASGSFDNLLREIRELILGA